MISAERFLDVLNAFEKKHSFTSYLIAYSGGVDSHVLMHLASQSQKKVRAIYINHGLQKEAKTWGEHCADVCHQLRIPFNTINVDASPTSGESPEEAARNARYQALFSELQQNECLLTAHHLDDQSETFLLQLMRGAGPAGLASMPALKYIDNKHLARPLLGYSRQEIIKYAAEHKLDWVEDPSNQLVDIDRNLLRSKILPELKKRWPKLNQSIAQAANQQQDALEIIEAMAATDLASMVSSDDALNIKQLLNLPRSRRLNVLRYWIKQNADDNPTSNILSQIVDEVLEAPADSAPLARWNKTEVRRYKNMLTIMPVNEGDETVSYNWNPEQPLVMTDICQQLTIRSVKKNGLSNTLLKQPLVVKFRQGGERMHVNGKKHSQSLKKLMQEADIPTWQRSKIPLIYLGDELIYVCDHWAAQNYCAEKDQQGWLPILEQMQ